MVAAAQFDSLTSMDSSVWLRKVKEQFGQNEWPSECRRCEQTESINGTSIRLNAIEFDKKQTQSDYLTVGGVLDNICNSACWTCNERLSTKIGSLKSKTYPIVDNTNRFWELPQHRIVHLDINGGEPSASKNYKQVLANLPHNVKSVRVNTNGSLIINELEDVLARDIEVTVTVSLDGIGAVHDWIRWPIKWTKILKNILKYKEMPLTQLNTWTTVSAMNINSLPIIQQFCQENQLLHSWALLDSPDPLNVKYQNTLTLSARDIIPGQVAVDRNNQHELDVFLLEQENLRK
jgi:sulfatase maturation enzyme AslB (radical SAM superfamily)